MTIDADGLFEGERLRKCSDHARLLWPYLFLKSNGFARLEIDLPVIISHCFLAFKTPPSKEEIAKAIREYRDVGLLFLWSFNGKLWGEWICPESCKRRYKTAKDEKSPVPPKYDFDAYIVQHTETTIVPYLAEMFLKIPYSSQTTLHGVGVGVGVGVGEGNSKPCAKDAPTRSKVPIDIRHAPIREMIQKAWRDKNPDYPTAPWDGHAATVLARILKNTPRWNVAHYANTLANWLDSEVNHAEAPVLWIPKLPKFAGGPLDKFGKPKAKRGNAIEEAFSQEA